MSHPYGPPPPPYGPPQPQPPPYGQGPVVVPGARSYAVGSPAPYAVPVDPNAIGNHRAWAVVALVLSLGTGVLALIRSNEVDRYRAQGNLVLAKEASDSTRVLCLFATLQGLALWIVIVVAIVLVVS